MTVIKAMRRGLRDSRGASSIEYALIGGLIAVVVCTAIGTTGAGTNGLYGKVGTAFNTYIR